MSPTSPSTPHHHQQPSPKTLLIYPITLLLGSLFSVLSPTARNADGSIPNTHTHPDAFLPSLANDINTHAEPTHPVNYFARKNNLFNAYFVKIGWAWTTLAFVSLLFQAPYSSTHRSTQRIRRLAQAALRYALATTAWYLTTQWFFGPPVIDRGFVVTGGRCERLEHAHAHGHPHGGHGVLEELLTSAACKAAGGDWRGGHDVSGHVFMLVLASAVLGFEAVGARAAVSVGGGGKEKSGSDDVGTSSLAVWAGRFVWVVSGMSWWMLFMTAIWFHTWLEKVSLPLWVYGICND